jgi:hypothetical protein
MVNEVTKPLEALVIVVATMDLIKALSERQWLMWHLIKDIIVEEVLDKEAIAKAMRINFHLQQEKRKQLIYQASNFNFSEMYLRYSVYYER